jgi:dolichol-phosphate mannosyltransferase
MAREAVDALNSLPESHRFVRGLVPWLGFCQTHVEYTAPARWAGRSKYTFTRSLRLALEGVTSFHL